MLTKGEKAFKVDIDKVELVFKALYLFHIILCSNIYYVDTIFNTISSALVLISGAFIVLYRVFNYKKYTNYTYIWLYVLFIVAYGISILFNYNYGLVSNIKIMIWMTFFFFILYLFDKNKSQNRIRFEIAVLGNEICLLSTITSAISLLMLIFNYNTFHTTPSGKIFLVGMANWGRMYGVVTDPNYAAVIAVVAVVLAIAFFIKCNSIFPKGLYVFCIVVNVCSIIFSASRTGLVTMCITLACFSFIYVLNKNKTIFRAALSSVLVLFIVLGVNKGVIFSYNSYVDFKATHNQSALLDNGENTSDSENNTEEIIDIGNNEQENLVEIGREGELEGDISNRRFDLWNNALQVFQRNPIVGVSFGGIVPYCVAEFPEAYLLTNGFSIFDAFHNMPMDLIASQGILGTIIFVGIILLSMRFLLVNVKKLGEDSFMCLTLFSVCLGMIVSSLFVSEILYVHTQTTVVFWVLWGYLIGLYTKNVEISGE